MRNIASARSVLVPAVVCVSCIPAVAEDWSSLADVHLRFVKRSDEERLRIEEAVAPARDFAGPEAFEGNPAGAATVRRRADANAFSLPSANIGRQELDFHVGNGLFRKLWVSAPASTRASDGLGPLFNARSCQSCHIKDGRGHPPADADDDALSLIVKISLPAEDAAAAAAAIPGQFASIPDPRYGSQLQDRGIQGQRPEYRLKISHEEIEVQLSEGQRVLLSRPVYEIADLGYGPLDARARFSPRVAPQMIGLGLLEAIEARDILAHADPDDDDGDGISGRANVIWSHQHGRPMLGRFGLKAAVASIREQTAAAFGNDIGIANPLLPQPWGDCTDAQPDCRSSPHGGDRQDDHLEIGSTGFELVVVYSRNLGVPARVRISDPKVLQGKRVFHESGCASCHVPKFVTGRLADDVAQSFQLIWPYSDMLLHDMGEALADGSPEGRASGREWRTAPLWGIGLTRQVSGHSRFLHDGRARSLLEAILWHGGEAAAARQRVVAMPKSDRDALIEFLESL